MKPIKSWHFMESSKKLRYGDNRKAIKGRTHKVKGTPRLCRHGLHASIKPLDALGYAPGNIISRVVVGGEIIKGDDKIVGTERTYLWIADAEQILREFSRWCALEVVHLWDAPDIVVQYLKTGDEILWDAARAAAWAAATDAARAAAWDAATDAARDKFLLKANKKLTKILNKLEPK